LPARSVDIVSLKFILNFRCGKLNLYSLVSKISLCGLFKRGRNKFLVIFAWKFCVIGGECYLVTNTGECYLVTNTGECYLVNITGECYLVNNTGECYLVNNTGECYLVNNTGEC